LVNRGYPVTSGETSYLDRVVLKKKKTEIIQKIKLERKAIIVTEDVWKRKMKWTSSCTLVLSSTASTLVSIWLLSTGLVLGTNTDIVGASTSGKAALII